PPSRPLVSSSRRIVRCMKPSAAGATRSPCARRCLTTTKRYARQRERHKPSNGGIMIRTAYARDVHASTAVRSCRDQLGPDRPDLILAFVGGKHAPEAA